MAPSAAKPAANEIARGPRSDDLAGQQITFVDTHFPTSFQCHLIASRFGLPELRASIIADPAFGKAAIQ